MPDTIPLIIACGDYDHTQPLKDGTVRIENCSTEFVRLSPGEMFGRAFDDPQFNVAELSLANYISRRIEGNCDYVAIPAYVARRFRHSNLYARTDRGIRAPQDLRGRRVGIGGYNHTAPTWVRGILQDEYGVSPADIKWVSIAGKAHAHASEQPFQPPPGVSIEWINTTKPLAQMLEDGEIDALVATRAPAGRNCAYLFSDYKAAEDDYYRRTGVFPILHLMGIRSALVERHPWLPGKLYWAFLEAKNRALAAQKKTVAESSAPGALVAEVGRMSALMGDDYLPYGLNAGDRKTLTLLLKYHFEQGLAQRRYDIAELFSPVPMSEYQA